MHEMKRDLYTGYDSGSEMWNDNAAKFGVITARVICLNYLAMQAQTTDATEMAFCRQLQGTMAAAHNMTDVAVYNHNAAYAEIEGKTGIYIQSDKANHLCAGDIDIAIDACSYGDGAAVDYNLALTALTDQYGLDRLRFVLACEVNFDSLFGRYPNDLYQWARDMKIHENYGRMGVRTRPEYLLGLIEELRKMEPVMEKPSVLAALDEGKERVARADAARAEQNKPPTPHRRRGQEQGD